MTDRKPGDIDLHGNFDAMVWAERFVERVTENPGIATDEGTMLAWFSGAIMTGYDHARPQPLVDGEEWDFTRSRYPEDEWTLRDAVFQALGGASACWENLAGAGVFDSIRCGQIGEKLMAEIERLYWDAAKVMDE